MRKLIVWFFAASAAMSQIPVSGQSVWTGSAGDARWSAAGNWEGGASPTPTPLTSLTFGGSVTNAQNDFLSGSAFSNLTFAAGASPFTLSGNKVSLYGSLVNSSSAQQRIGTDLIWTGKNRFLDTGAGGILLDGFFSSGAADASFTKSGSGTLTLNGGGNFTAVDPISTLNGGTLIIAADTVFNRLDIKDNARLVVTNNATLSGFTGTSYVFWQTCTVDLYSGKINAPLLLTAQDWTKTCTVNVRGGVFSGGAGLRWANNGNVILTISGDGRFEMLPASPWMAENGGAHIIMNGGVFQRGAFGDTDLDVGYGLTSGTHRKSAGTITNRIDFNAGVFLTGAFTYSTTYTNLPSDLYFNGGTVRAGKATNAFFDVQSDRINAWISSGGLVFDTQGYAVTLNDALESGASPDGGLTKLGPGTLSISTNCTYTGPTTVSNGLLRIGAPLASTALRLAPFASAVLASGTFFSGSLSVDNGGVFSFTTNATTALSLSALTLGSVRGPGAVAFEITDSSHLDQISVTTSGGLDLSCGGNVLLYQPGTAARFSENGTYALFAYSGSLAGSADNLRVANPDPAKRYQFTGSAGVISLTISDGVGAEWVSGSDGDWSVAGNWSGSVPDAADAYALFLTNAASALTVTLDAPVTVGSLVFSNAAAYTLSGTQTLALAASAQQAGLVVQAGQHTVAVPLALAGGTLAQPSAGSGLTLAGGISGVGSLTVMGAGSVALTGTNQTRTLISDGTLTVRDGVSLAGGVAFDNGVLAVTQDTAVATAFEIGTRGAIVRPGSDATLTLASAASGEGTLRKENTGTLLLAAPLGNAGGVLLSAGTLAFTNDVFGAKPLQLGGGTLRHTGTDAVTLNAPVTVGAASVLRTEKAALTLGGPLAFSAAATLAVESTNGVTLAGTANVSDTGRKLQLREGRLRLASGADYTFSGGARDTVSLGSGSNQLAELVVESGARLKTGGIYLDSVALATNCACTVRQEGGRVEVTHTEGLYIRDHGLSDGTYLMNGGTFTAPASSWANVGSQGHGYLTVNGGAMTLGRLAMGYKDDGVSSYTGPGGHLAINGGRLAVAGSCSWMSDVYRNRYNTVVLGNGTPGAGELDLVATTRSTPYASGGGRTALTFDGGVLKAMGLAPYGTSSLTNYLYGVDSLTLRSGGAVIETPSVSIALPQPLRAAETNGGLVKCGMATLTLPSANNAWCGTTDVQAGTLRARLKQDLQHLYPEGVIALWTFDDGTPSDQSGNGFHLAQQNDTNVVTFVDGGFCGKAARFSGQSSLKISYTQAFDVTVYSVSAWVKLAARNIGHQGIFSTRVNAAENGNVGTFDFKVNGNGPYISNLNQAAPNSTGAFIYESMGGYLEPNVWYMLTFVVAPDRTDAYLNGVWKNSTNLVSVAQLLKPGCLLTLGRGIATETNPNGEMMGAGGMIDDVAIFNRSLSADEIAAMYETMLPRPPVRVAGDAAYDLLGSTNTAPSVTGGGTISNGVLVVTDSIDPDSAAGVASLSIENLILNGTNLVYACTVAGQTNDLVRVGGVLEVSSAGTIDLGRTADDPLATPFHRTVMTFGTLGSTDAQTLAQWKVTGDGITGKRYVRKVIVDTANNRVDVDIRFNGTLFFIR